MFVTTLHSSIFDDVTPAFKQWKSKDVKIYIYSSGSVAAQKLLFGNSKFGDLLQVIKLSFALQQFFSTRATKNLMHNLKKLRNSLRLQRKQLKILIVGGSVSIFLTNQEILIRDSLFCLHADA